MRQRLFLSCLSILALVYFALPRLPFHSDGGASLFSWLWLAFALMAFGGNISVLLYGRGRASGRGQHSRVGRGGEREQSRGTGI